MTKAPRTPISVLFTGNHFKPEKYENESAIFYKDLCPPLMPSLNNSAETTLFSNRNLVPLTVQIESYRISTRLICRFYTYPSRDFVASIRAYKIRRIFTIHRLTNAFITSEGLLIRKRKLIQ